MTLADVKNKLISNLTIDIGRTLNQIQTIIRPDSFYGNQIILTLGRWNGLKRDKASGIITNERATIQTNQIRSAVMDTIGMFGEEDIDFEKAKSELKGIAPTPSNSGNDDSSNSSGKQAEIYFSYGWGDSKEEGESREKIVNELYDSLKAGDFNVIRDKMNLEYGGLISDFMEKIGEGDLIVVFVSEKYVKSPYCMFELYEIARNCKWDKQLFAKRILPIKIERLDFADPRVLRKYMIYWKEEEQGWLDLIQDMPESITKAQSVRYHNTKAIRQNFGQLADWLADINSSTTSLLSKENFTLVKKTIVNRIGK